jgi:hypothetical protein
MLGNNRVEQFGGGFEIALMVCVKSSPGSILLDRTLTTW